MRARRELRTSALEPTHMHTVFNYIVVEFFLFVWVVVDSFSFVIGFLLDDSALRFSSLFFSLLLVSPCFIRFNFDRFCARLRYLMHSYSFALHCALMRCTLGAQ